MASFIRHLQAFLSGFPYGKDEPILSYHLPLSHHHNILTL